MLTTSNCSSDEAKEGVDLLAALGVMGGFMQPQVKAFHLGVEVWPLYSATSTVHVLSPEPNPLSLIGSRPSGS